MARMDLSPFQRDGYLAPVPLLTPGECRTLITHFEQAKRPPPADWEKGAAVTDWLLYRMATNPRLLEVLTPMLGRDIILWACSLVRSRPGDVHPWHVDIETTVPNGRYVSAWIGLENTWVNSLQLIAGSHVGGKSIQQVQAERGCRRGEASTETVLGWARERNPSAHFVEPKVKDGEAILFDGSMWHASRNDRRSGTRSALLLQFASADSPIRMHDDKLDWPFQFLSTPKPPTIVVQGTSSEQLNRVVPPPAPAVQQGMPMLSSCIRPLNMPLAEKPGGGWQHYPLFRGQTRIIDDMASHASVLSAGHSPHPPHAHSSEEIFIILDGEAEIVVADGPSCDGARVERVTAGDFAYVPAFQHHTIRNPGSSPVTYLMFKWHVDGVKPAADQLGTRFFKFQEVPPRGTQGFVTKTLFEQPTKWLGQLHCHASRLEPGKGYDAHFDAYDIAILMLSGRVETLGEEVGPNSVIFYGAGEKHGMRNPGDEPAHYLVFEFHPSTLNAAQWLRWRMKPFAKDVLKRAARAVGVDVHALRARMRRPH